MSYPVEYAYTTGTLLGNSDLDKTYGMGLLERILITVILTIMFVGVVNMFSGIVVALGVGIVFSAWMVGIGFVPIYAILPGSIIAFILITQWNK
jgi:hypothetical protein